MSDDHVRTTIDTYDKTANEFIEKVQAYAPEPEREKFVSSIKPGGSILDAGCGSGRDANYFASKGFVVTGIDLSETLLVYARNHSEKHVTFRTMDLRNIDFPDVSFYGIWACASLLHLKREEIAPVLRKFRDLLTAGGILFLLMKEGEGEKLAASSTISGDVRFFSYYSTVELKGLTTDAGFLVTELYTWDQNDRNPERPSERWISVFATRGT